MTTDLEAVDLIRIHLPLVRPFRTSFGTMTEKDAILIKAVGSDGAAGWGECVAAEEPSYSEEWNDAAWTLLRDLLIPAALSGRQASVRGNRMARAALDLALLDLDLRRRGVGLAAHLGGSRDRVPCGVSLGIEDRLEDLLSQIEARLTEGYRRVKLKIEPGKDVDVVRAVRNAFPDASLSVDANAAYGPGDGDHLSGLDAFDLAYLEQPLPADHLLGHADLQERLTTPVCLDETITSPTIAAEAIRLGACRVINIKMGRVGGPAPAAAIHDLALAQDVPVWCGGMLETGIGRAANLALASLPGFTLPGDTSASARYFPFDLTEPFVMAPDGTMAVPSGAGLGVAPIPDILDRVSVERTTVRAA